jgi:FKBP-type peptidyl-prolyl cis-trans isomerase
MSKKQMKKLLMCVWLGMSLMACQKKLESDAETALNQNEVDIQNYITAQNLKVTKTATGLYYQKLKENPMGDGFKVGDELTIHFTLYTLRGAILDSTERLKNKPYAFAYGGTRLLPGMEEGLFLSKKGEKIQVLMNHPLAFGSQSSDILPAYSALGSTMEILKVRTETQQVDEYIIDKKLTLTEKTTSGLRFIRTTASTEELVKTGQTVQVKYTGKLLNDKVFDSGQFAVTVGAGRTIKGFEEGIAKMRRGEKATLVFSSDLGYGSTAPSASIPGYAPLAFEVEVLK